MRSGVKQGLFLRIEEFARRRYRLVFLVTILAVLGSIYLGRRLSLDGDVLNLVPRTNRAVSTFREALEDFGSLDYLLVLVQAREGQGVEDLQDYADLLAEELQALDSIQYVEHKVDTGGPFFEFFRTHQLLFLPPDRLDDLAAKFDDDAIRERVRDNLRQLTGPSSFMVKQLLEQDPFLVSPLLFQAVLGNRGPLKVDLQSGYYLARDGTALLLIAKPVKPAQDVAFDKRLIVEVEAAAIRARARFEADLEPAGGGPAPAAPETAFGGGYVIAVDDSGLIMQDMVRNGVLSFVVIVMLYYFCYRRFSAILYSSVPLMVGQFLTLAVAWIFLRNLNSATTGFSAMLMGLGTDFTIVMYARYVEERVRGHAVPEALRRMMGTSAFGVFTGAITSAGTFYSMCITDYKGLRDFGFLVGSGILLCTVAILFLMPAMITFNEGRARNRDKPRRLYLHSFGLERAIGWSTRHPWPVVVGSIVVTLAMGALALRLEFSDNVQDLRSPHNRGILMQETIARKFGAAFSPMMVVSRGPDLDTALDRNREANQRLDAFVADGTLQGYESIFSYVPARQDQQEVIATLQRGAWNDFDVRRIERTFRTALRANGFREEIYDPFLKSLPATLSPDRPVTIQDLQAAGLDRFVSRYLKQGDVGWTAVTYVFPADPKAKRHAPAALVRALDTPGDGIEITGVNIVSTELRRIFKRDARRAILLGLAVVTILLWLDFRSLRLTTLAMAQLLTGVIWMLGGMTLLGIKVNFINAFVTTMILGVGIDYGIHIIHRIHEEGLTNPAGLMETGKAVVMAALTNVGGFGTIGLSNYPGLQSMGLVCVLGSITCLITALTTLPALMIVVRSRAAKT
jgi:hypothetical protein